MKKFSFIKNLGTVIALVVSLIVSFVGPSGAVAATSVGLGTADSFAVLAGASITNVPTSTISGDVGLDPAAGTLDALTTGQVTGTIYNNSGTGPGVQNAALLTSAKNDLTTAYLNAEAQTPSTTVLASTTDSFSGTGYTLAPGIYKSPSTMGITGTLTLNGSASDIWIFQAVSSLTTAAGANIVLAGGAQACNVFWQVGSSATLGTGTLFKGSILALTSITDNGGSTVNGRLLARNATVALNNTTVIKPTCVAPPVVGANLSVGGIPPRPETFAPPLINIVKVPTPLALSSGPGSVTYDYTVTNVGIVPIQNVVVTDNKCANVIYVSGDTNTDSILALNETWHYRCITTLSQTTTNTVTAMGQANGYYATDTANATVVVSAPIVPPLIHLVKTPNIFLLPASGGAVTYSYVVTNPGTVPLSNVSVTDNKCTGLPGLVFGNPGDLNHNNLLESNETWTFTCLTNINQTTTNIGTAEGNANGLTAIDFSPATVNVAPPVVPALPNTGVTPENRNIFIMAAGALMLILLASLFVALRNRKKETI